MSTNSLSRRRFCQVGLSSMASIAALGLAACGEVGPGASKATTLRLYFWGPASRNQLTKKAIQSYKTVDSSVTIQSAFSDWSSYWDKLNTQIAGGTIPDLIQMDIAYIARYAKQNIIMDLAALTSNKTIDISKQDTTLLENSKYNGKLYGIPLGGNYGGMIYDTDLVSQSGVGAPPPTMTYSEFAQYTKKLTAALKNKGGAYGTVDASSQIMNFEAWIRQLGKNLYTADGKLGFEVDDVTSWFEYWNGLRASGACVPAQMQASVSGSSAGSSLIIQGKAVFDTSWSNQFSGFQQLTKHKLAMYMLPKRRTPKHV